MSEAEQKQTLHEKAVRVDWHFPDNLVSKYANNVSVQQGQYEFIISFFETQPPPLLGTPEENSAKLMQLESVRAECVARMIVPPALVKQIIQALQTTLDMHEAIQATKKEE